jgi:hypothetical protein
MKKQYKYNKTYICLGCMFVFTVHTEKKKSVKYTFCPSCGDSVDVERLKHEKKRPEQRKWNDRELKLVDKVISGDLKVYHVAYITKRTERSVVRRVQRRREELNK